MTTAAIPFFSVVIPTCHRNTELTQCLERLAPGRQTFLGEAGTAEMHAGQSPAGGAQTPYEVIVTDDGSRSTAEALVRTKFPWVHWVAGPRRGPAVNRNHGARYAKGRWIVFTDDDCLPAGDWLGAFAARIRAGGNQPQVLEGRTEAIGDQPHPLAQCPVNQSGGCLWSCNFAIQRPLFENLGGFNEDFPFAAVEDMEFNIRLRKHGVVPDFVSAALVEHPWKEVGYLALRRKQMSSQLLLRRLHPEQRSWISLRMHGRRVGRFYFKELALGFRQFGWQQWVSLPVQMCDQVQTAVILMLHNLQVPSSSMATKPASRAVSRSCVRQPTNPL